MTFRFFCELLFHEFNSNELLPPELLSYELLPAPNIKLINTMPIWVSLVMFFNGDFNS